MSTLPKQKSTKTNSNRIAAGWINRNDDGEITSINFQMNDDADLSTKYTRLVAFQRDKTNDRQPDLDLVGMVD